MKYAYTAVALSMATVAIARPAFTNLSFDVVEGEPFTLEFTGCEGGCTITLKNGDRGDLQDVEPLTTSAEGGSFDFTPESLPTDTYTFEIVNNDSGEDNYSQQFSFEGTGEAPEPTSSVVTETITSSIVVTTSAESTTAEETSTTEASSTEESTSATTPSASTTVTSVETQTETETESSSATDDATSTTDEAGASSTSEIPDPDAAAMAVGSSMTLVVAAVAGLLMFN